MAKAQRVLSIEIGYSLTQVCEMDYNAKSPKVYGVFSMKTPDGILDDGYIRPTEEFINDRLEKIDAELGSTEGALESYKKRNSVTQLQMDASQFQLTDLFNDYAFSFDEILRVESSA